MPTLEIKLKDGVEIQIHFKINELLTRKSYTANTKELIQLFTNPSGTFGLTIKESEIASVEKRDGIIISLPNVKPGPMGI